MSYSKNITSIIVSIKKISKKSLTEAKSYAHYKIFKILNNFIED